MGFIVRILTNLATIPILFQVEVGAKDVTWVEEIEKEYSRHKTLTAKFKQKEYKKSFNKTTQSRGEFWLKVPGRVRWQIQEPNPSLLVSNGKKFWFYTPPLPGEESGQVIIKNSAEVETQWMRALLYGDFKFKKGTRLKSVGANSLEMIPAPMAAGGVAKAIVRVDRKLKRILEVVIEYRGGNQTTVELHEIRLGAPLEDGFFEFQPPLKTDEIQM